MKLLLASALLLMLSTVTADGSAVYDASGEPLKSGTSYYIKSAIGGAVGGGLWPALHYRNSFYVRQSPDSQFLGSSVIFYPFNPSIEIIQLESDVKIEFNFHLPLNEPATWRLEHESSMQYVAVGGALTPENTWFKIQEAGELAYKLWYCPSVPRSDDTCGHLGLIPDGRAKWLVRRLAFSDTPFSVVFIKSNASEAISHVTA